MFLFSLNFVVFIFILALVFLSFGSIFFLLFWAVSNFLNFPYSILTFCTESCFNFLLRGERGGEVPSVVLERLFLLPPWVCCEVRISWNAVNLSSFSAGLSPITTWSLGRAHLLKPPLEFRRDPSSSISMRTASITWRSKADLCCFRTFMLKTTSSSGCSIMLCLAMWLSSWPLRRPSLCSRPLS